MCCKCNCHKPMPRKLEGPKPGPRGPKGPQMAHKPQGPKGPKPPRGPMGPSVFGKC